MTLVLRGTRVHGQLVSARIWLESTKRVTKVEVVSFPSAVPAGRGSLVLSGALGLNTGWGASYRVTSVTTVGTDADGELSGPVQITPRFDKLVRDEGERVRVRCSVELAALVVRRATGGG